MPHRTKLKRAIMMMKKKNTNYDEETTHPSSSISNRKRRLATTITAHQHEQEEMQSILSPPTQSQSSRRSLQSYAQQFVIHHKEPDELSTYKPTSSPTTPTTQKPTLNFIPLGPIPSSPSNNNNPNPNKPPSTWWTQAPTTPRPTPSPTPLPTSPKQISSIITGHAFFDSNSNGIFDTTTNTSNSSGDYNMSNVNVWLFTCGGNSSSMMIDKTSTSSQGIFTFENLVSGTYMVIIQLPQGYESSTSITAPWDATTTQQEESSSPYMMLSNNVGHDKENTEQVDNNNNNEVLEESSSTRSSSTRSSTTCTSLCFKIHSNEDSYIELSFGMQKSPTGSPTYTPTSGSPTSNVPSKKPTTSTPTVTSYTSSSSSQSPTAYPPTISTSTTPLPTRSGTQVGPITTNELRITLFGIDSIPNVDEWDELMSLYINQYFNTNDSGQGDNENEKWAFNVDTDVSLTSQSSKLVGLDDNDEGVTTDEAKKKKKLRQLDVNQQGRRRRRLQSSSTSNNGEPSVEIIYNQVSTYKTYDPSFVDVTYIIQEPFATTLSRYEYISYLQMLSTDYDNVSSVSPVILPPGMRGTDVGVDGSNVVQIIPPPPPPPPDQDEDATNSAKQIGIYIGIAIGILVLILGVNFAFIYHRRRRQQESSSSQPPTGESAKKKKKVKDNSKRSGSYKSSSAKFVDSLLSLNGASSSSSSGEHEPHASIPPPHTWQVGRNLDMSLQDIYPESLGQTKKTLRDPSSHGRDPSTHGGGTYATHTTSTTHPHTLDSEIHTSEVIIDILIPPGRVGCIIDSSPKKGPYICEIDDTSPLRDELHVGDRIIAVDEVDVRRMNAINVSKLLGSRSSNEERILTVLREFVYETSSGPYVEVQHHHHDESGEYNEGHNNVSPLYGSDERMAEEEDEDEERTETSSVDPPGITSSYLTR